MDYQGASCSTWRHHFFHCRTGLFGRTPDRQEDQLHGRKGSVGQRHTRSFGSRCERRGRIRSPASRSEFAQPPSPTGELSTEPEGLAFAHALSEDPTRLGTDMATVDGSDTTVNPSAHLELEPPPPIANAEATPPTSGWAVQVAAYPLVTEADAKVETLRSEGLAAYRVAAVVDGKNWYRVRIGGFESEKDAYTALKELRVRLQQPQLLIASAP